MDESDCASMAAMMLLAAVAFSSLTYAAVDANWKGWALDNGYAHYDQRLGVLVLHEKAGCKLE